VGTNSVIFYEKSSNEFHGISCHFDGYLSGVGATLYKHYQNQEKIEKLISLGDISSLDKECETAPRYEMMGYDNNAEQRHLGYTFAYHRDWGRKLDPTIIVNGLDELTKNFHAYVWRKDKWFTYNYEEKKWHTLKDELIALAKENERDESYYLVTPKTIEFPCSYKDFNTNIFRGFLILKSDDLTYSKGDYIKFKATEDNHNYELLLRVNDVVEHEGIKDGYQLILLSSPPKDFVWYSPVRYV
jgi:hypothetical protein